MPLHPDNKLRPDLWDRCNEVRTQLPPGVFRRPFRPKCALLATCGIFLYGACEYLGHDFWITFLALFSVSPKWVFIGEPLGLLLCFIAGVYAGQLLLGPYVSTDGLRFIYFWPVGFTIRLICLNGIFQDWRPEDAVQAFGWIIFIIGWSIFLRFCYVRAGRSCRLHSLLHRAWLLTVIHRVRHHN